MVDPPTEPHPIGANLHHVPGSSTSSSSRGSDGSFWLVYPVFLCPMAAGKTQNQCRDIAGMFFRNPENRLLGYQPEVYTTLFCGVFGHRKYLPFRIGSRIQP